jgi:AcrR family transcriptional regulator
MATTTPLAQAPKSKREKAIRPRKAPRQQRAVETRARILEAAAEVFTEHGYAAGTTNRIAERAGMSVGSLYQYFPNKDAILVELVELHIAEGTAVLAPILERALTGELAIEPLVREVVHALAALHVRDRRLHQVLWEESPRPASVLRDLHAIEDLTFELVEQILGQAERPPGAPALSARIAVTTVESLVHRLVANDRALDLEAFEAETTRLVVGYLDPEALRLTSG